jgi:hypothetical protein
VPVPKRSMLSSQAMAESIWLLTYTHTHTHTHTHTNPHTHTHTGHKDMASHGAYQRLKELDADYVAARRSLLEDEGSVFCQWVKKRGVTTCVKV